MAISVHIAEVLSKTLKEMPLAWAHRACQGQHVDWPVPQPGLHLHWGHCHQHCRASADRAWLLWTPSCLFLFYDDDTDGGGHLHAST